MSVYFNKSKGWWVYEFVHNKKRFTSAGFETKRDAQREEAQRKEEVIHSTPGREKTAITQTGMDFLTLCNRRLDHSKTYHTEGHFRATLGYVKSWTKHWGRLNCDEISQDMVEKYIHKKGKAATAGANMELRLLRALFNYGIKKNYVSANPAAGIDFFPENAKRRRTPPPKEDVLNVIAVADPDTQDYLWTLALTAARVGEINALTWNDVDFKRRLVTLWTRKRKNSNREPRDVAMVQKLYDILDRRYAKRNPDMPWVFWHSFYSVKEGKTVSGPYRDRKKIMATLCDKADVPYFRFHPFRHLTASLLDDLGVPLGVIQKILGHQNRRTTEIYLHPVSESERRAMELLEKDSFTEVVNTNPEAPTNMHREYWQRKVERPSYEVLVKEIELLGYVGTGKKYGVSNNAVKKWVLNYEKEAGVVSVPQPSFKKSQTKSQTKSKRG